MTFRLSGPPGPMCQPGGAYNPEFRAERFKLPYSYAPFRPVLNDVRSALEDATAPAVVRVPVFGYGADIAITYSYQGTIAVLPSTPGQCSVACAPPSC